MALTKLPKNAIADGAVKDNNIADGTIQNQDISGSISNDKLANSSFTLNGTEVSLGASQSIVTYLDWQAVSVADGSTQVTAEAGKGYFLDTNAGVIEVFLPSSPTRGDVVGLVDYAGTFGTNQLIINTGGVNIDSTVGSEFKVTTNNAIVECVYVDSAKGWLVYLNQAAGTTPSSVINAQGGYDTLPPFISATGGTVTTSGDYKIHTFTGDGCFVVSNAGNPGGSDTVDYLVVAGGGGGGFGRGGGGGAGGFRESSGAASGCYTASPLGACVSALPISVTTYPVTVGAGGPPGGYCNCGSPSGFATITSTGGGGGEPAQQNGKPGGSGGGGGAPIGLGSSGNTPPVSPPQGNDGGFASPSDPGGSGGGGGATAAGQDVPSGNNAGDGGNGATTSISGSPTTYSGGGGGGYDTRGGGSAGTGGSGGGGNGQTPGQAGTANTGGGGGGSNFPACSGTGGAGGKGIVIIRYKFQ